MNREDIEKEIVAWKNKLPNPTYIHKVGDKVTVGYLQNCIIEEVLEDGKLYLIDYVETDKYKNTKHCKTIRPWINVRKVNNTEIDFICKDMIQINYSQCRLSELININYDLGYNMNPFYQRGLVWTLEDKVNLIDSMFNKIDIGKFVFVEDSSYILPDEILDGKQRLTTIIDFYEDRFEYKGYKFSDLSFDNQQFIKNYPVNVARLRNLTDKQKIETFIRLNTMGKIIDKDHLEEIKRKFLEK